LTRLFGFAQLDFAGTLAVADGRYVLRDGEIERVLVLETLGAPAPPRRRRRKPREAEAGASPTSLPLARATLVRAFEPFADEGEAKAWMQATSVSEERLDALLADATASLNRALHTHAVAGGDPSPQAIAPERAVAVRVGYGIGPELADGAFSEAREVDPSRGFGSRRQQRDADLRPQQRIAAVLGGRERLDTCETLLLRARADLEAGRNREAALQLRVGLEAFLLELKDALNDSGHAEDMATLEARRTEAGDAANAALAGDLTPTQLKAVEDMTATCERVLRRRRILTG
jgi:hypothetical protein